MRSRDAMASLRVSRVVVFFLMASAVCLLGQERIASGQKSEHSRLDDGTAETGYGFVPSAKWGEVVQRFERTHLAGDLLTGFCVCWLKKRGDQEMDFEVVLYTDSGGRPSGQASWAEKASVVVEARTKEDAGAVDCVDMKPKPLPEAFFLGVRWDPGEEAFAFVCADHSSETAKAPGFFREDRARGWASVYETRDPNFGGHRALMLWPRSGSRPASPKANASSAPVE